MQKHHGDITMKSKLGQGTTFTLSFPSKGLLNLPTNIILNQ